MFQNDYTISLNLQLISYIVAIFGGGVPALYATYRGVRFVSKFINHARASIATLVALATLLLGTAGTRFHMNWAWDAKVQEYLKAAIATDDQEKAMKYLDTAVAFHDERGATEGHTSVLYPTPNEDLGDFVVGLRSAQEAAHSEDTRTIIDGVRRTPWVDKLIKAGVVTAIPVRSELDPNTIRGYRYDLKYPSGIGAAPYNGLFFWGMTGTAFFMLLAGAWVAYAFTAAKGKWCSQCRQYHAEKATV